jgi:hypothetical protein
MTRSILYLLFVLQFFTTNVRADGLLIGSAKNFILGDVEILEAVKRARDFLNTKPNTVEWSPNSFSIFFAKDSIFIKLAPVRVGELPSANRNVSAFFELRRSDLEVINFDLCSTECGIFFVKWFKQPEKIDFYLNGK